VNTVKDTLKNGKQQQQQKNNQPNKQQKKKIRLQPFIPESICGAIQNLTKHNPVQSALG